jgi:hypothetical protein
METAEYDGSCARAANENASLKDCSILTQHFHLRLQFLDLVEIAASDNGFGLALSLQALAVGEKGVDYLADDASTSVPHFFGEKTHLLIRVGRVIHYLIPSMRAGGKTPSQLPIL